MHFNRFIQAAVLLITALSSLFISGCVAPGPDVTFGVHRPANIYQAYPVLPQSIRRVAMLPLTSDRDEELLSHGRERFGSVLHSELVKTRKFDVVRVDPEFLRNRTGKVAWGETEVLPADLMAALQEKYGCDAVLFSELTRFRAYPPLAIGLRMRLVDVETGQTVWAGDEVFDAGRPDVGNAARQYASREQVWRDPAWSIRHSPDRFGQYALAELLGTLPER